MFKELGAALLSEAEDAMNAFMAANIRMTPHTPKNEREPKQLPYIMGTREADLQLREIVEKFANAARYFLADEKYASANKATGLAEMVALQVGLINQGYSKFGTLCIMKAIEDRRLAYYAVNNILSPPQALVMHRAIEYNVDWAMALYEQCVLKKNEKYLDDFLDRVIFTEEIMNKIYLM